MVDADRDEGPDEEYGVLKAEDDPRSKEEIVSTIARKHPIELEEQIDTLDSPVVIECASPGWQPDVWPPEDAYPEGESPPNYTEAGDTRYSAIPCSIEDQAQTLIDAIEEGCAATHVHPRDPEDCLGTDDVGLLADIYDRVFDATDAVTVQHSWQLTDGGSVDYVEMAREKLAAADGSNKYIQASIVLWPTFDSYPERYSERVSEGVEFYREHDIKPIHKVRSEYDTRKLYRELNRMDYLEDEDPLCIFHDMGHPFGWPLDQDPWMPIEMIAGLEGTKQRFPDDTVIGVCSGGRNWLPITMEAIVRGVDYIRVGIEDYYWMYPHRDEVIQHNIDCVRKVVQMCEILGRDVATPEQARDILGIELT
jgi:uncharacterized protein (DUF849 family)